MPMNENFDIFLSTSEFAYAATYSGNTINVLFDDAYIDANGIESVQPNITGKESDLSAANQDDTIVVDGTTYVMRELQPDGYGLMHVLLTEQ